VIRKYSSRKNAIVVVLFLLKKAMFQFLEIEERNLKLTELLLKK
jgi:hypothetical protein